VDISINKFISDTGFCSRREADKMLDAGRVTLNGNVANKGNRVGENDEVLVDGEPLKKKASPVYIAFNKPVGVTCTTDEKDRFNIINFLKYPKRIFPIGRLDKDSEGLIFLTNDGDIVNKILRAGNNHEKEYIVTVNKPIANSFIRKMGNGVPVLGQLTKKCKIDQTSPTSFRIVLTQGLNRQIRRMCSYLGYKVIKLKRVRIMHVKLNKLSTGQWRYLDQKEIAEMNQLISSSRKTEEASLMKHLDDEE
jgi:23S rRNA pseudouridine2604 synthase